MYKYIALTALVLGSAALGFNMNRGGEDQFTLAWVEEPVDTGTDLDWLPGIIDINQDGLDDLIQPYDDNEYDTSFDLAVRMNQGDMSFSPWESIGTFEVDPLPDYSGRMWVLDVRILNINSDPYPDLVARAYEHYWGRGNGTDYRAWRTLYFINNGSGGFTCAGDVTDDGRTNVDDLLGVIGDWGCIEEGQPD